MHFAPDQEPTAENNSTVTDLHPVPQTAAKPVCVWLVDDHDRLRHMIAETLELQGGIQCTRHFDSPNSLLSALASRLGPDVILLDVQMGELNGVDAVPAIKSLARDTRVLMLTTTFNPEWKQRAMDAGASGFLLKTQPMETIAATIRQPSSEDPSQRRLPGRILRQRAAACQNRSSHDQFGNPKPSRTPPTSLFSWLKVFGRN